MHTLVGNAGHFFVITAFVTALLATVSFWKATISSTPGWKGLGRITFYVHFLAITGVIATLFWIILNHYFEYHYAWAHSSRNMPGQYLISCFWEGQEGSFLLWMFWNAVLGLILIKVNKFWETPVMSIFCLVQAFLASMILGIVILDVKIGSSPFILLKNAMPDAPIFKMNPDFVPKDGQGLNPLLQNYWMTIHPPTLFLGFAATLIPFSYCIAGLWLQRYKEWVRPAIPWTTFAAMILGVGILMGGYWAYETLNFGGYWNWDPVENAVYIPWLILIGGLHTMISYQKSHAALKSTMILIISTFVLILYSTFLTRSGILGNSSVHSFTDLGLSGQLLIYLLAFLFLSAGLLIARWKYIPVTEKEINTYSREFWIFIGATILCLAGFQVLITTSIPVYNKILELIGIESNVAPPADKISHYNKFQLWFAVGIAILSGIGQFFWWTKMDKKVLKDVLILPLLLTLLISSLVILGSKMSGLADFQKISYIALLTSSVFTVIANFLVIANIAKSNINLSGGSVAHIGIGLMLIGILFSSGYSEVISINRSGMVYNKDFPEEMNKKNLLLWQNDPVSMGNYQLIYEGQRLEAEGFPGYISSEALMETGDPHYAIAKKNIKYGGETYYKKGDTVKVYSENTYFEVTYKKENGEKFTLYPRAQVNPEMGLIASPDIKRLLSKDLYTHVSSIPDPDQKKDWGKPEKYKVKPGDTIIVNDYITVFQGIDQLKNIPGIKMDKINVAVKARLKVLGQRETYTPEPIYLIKDKQVGYMPAEVKDLGIRFRLTQINPDTGNFTLTANTAQKDYIILKAVKKPFINVLWIGTFIMVIGFCMSIGRRYKEFRKMQNKGME